MTKQDLLNSIKAPAIAILKLFDLYSLVLLKHAGALKNAGWFYSMQHQAAIDYNKNPIPWMTYPAIIFINERVSSDMSIFEYGSGNSTLWWAKRVKKVVSCDHDKNWHDKVKMSAPENVQLFQINLEYGKEYSRKISEYHQEFDIIVIDGRDRVNCVKNALSALKEDGVIIWDNSDRASYAEGYDYLLSNGYKRIDFTGMGAMSVESWSTAIFYKTINCLGI